MIRIKRIYEAPEVEDGHRVLVDRIWPRGLSKEVAAVDLWMKEIAPSTELRKWFSHEPQKWPQFQEKYLGELQSDERKECLKKLQTLSSNGVVTLLFAAKDTERNNAVVLETHLASDV